MDDGPSNIALASLFGLQPSTLVCTPPRLPEYCFIFQAEKTDDDCYLATIRLDKRLCLPPKTNALIRDQYSESIRRFAFLLQQDFKATAEEQRRAVLLASILMGARNPPRWETLFHNGRWKLCRAETRCYKVTDLTGMKVPSRRIETFVSYNEMQILFNTINNLVRTYKANS